MKKSLFSKAFPVLFLAVALGLALQIIPVEVKVAPKPVKNQQLVAPQASEDQTAIAERYRKMAKKNRQKIVSV